MAPLPPQLAALVEPCEIGPPSSPGWWEGERYGCGSVLSCRPCVERRYVIATLRAVAADARNEAVKVALVIGGSAVTHPLNIYADRLTELADQIERGETKTCEHDWLQAWSTDGTIGVKQCKKCGAMV